MDYETAVAAMKSKAEVFLGADRLPGKIDGVELGRDTYIAKFTSSGTGSWTWVRVEELELADAGGRCTCDRIDVSTLAHSATGLPPQTLSGIPNPECPVHRPTDPTDHFAGKSLLDLVDVIRQATWSEGGGPEDIEPVKTAYDEIRLRLEAIQVYRGTEATLIRLILSGRRPVK
jgi:hypothetical protein